MHGAWPAIALCNKVSYAVISAGPDGARVMPKQQKQAELDAKLAGLRAARAEAFQQRVDKYNSSVKLKSRHALQD